MPIFVYFAVTLLSTLALLFVEVIAQMKHLKFSRLAWHSHVLIMLFFFAAYIWWTDFDAINGLSGSSLHRGGFQPLLTYYCVFNFFPMLVITLMSTKSRKERELEVR